MLSWSSCEYDNSVDRQHCVACSVFVLCYPIMINYSKLHLDQVLESTGCGGLAHPWNEHCLPGYGIFALSCAKGSFKFGVLLHLMQTAFKLRSNHLSVHLLRDALLSCTRTVVGLGTVASCVVVVSCNLRRALGCFYLYTTLWVPGFLSGLWFQICDPAQRPLFANTLLAMMLELSARKVEQSGYFTRTRASDTLCFMLANAYLMYLCRQEAAKPAQIRAPNFWIFNPPKLKIKDVQSEEGARPCPHKGSCMIHVYEGMTTFFHVGYILELVKTIISKRQTMLESPEALLRVIFNQNSLSFGLFGAGYIGLYRLIGCLLAGAKQEDTYSSTILAGFLAGSAFYIHPVVSFISAIAANIITIQIVRARARGWIRKDIPMDTLLFAVSFACSLHVRMLNPTICPSYIFNAITTITSRRDCEIYNILMDKLDAVKAAETLIH